MKIKDIAESFERKFNPSGTLDGRRTAHRELGAEVKKLVEEKKLDPMRISFKALWEQLVTDRGLEENIVSSAFPTIAGEIISTVMIQAYQGYPRSGDRLVRVVPSKLKTSMIVGWKAIGRISQVNEREPYGQTVPPDEKTITIENKKYGGLMDLTKEAIFFDQTGELIDRARGLGEEGARYRDEIIMNKVCDVNGDALGGAVLYSGGNSNLLTTNPLGTTGWENAHVELMSKKDDATSKPIWVMGDRPIMVVPTGLYPLSWKLQQNEYGPQGTANLDRNMAQNMYDIVVNPYLTKASTDWWYGGFNREFRWEEVWPLEVYTRVGQDTEEGFKQDVIQQFKVSFYGGCGAADTRYTLENNA
jgi:hypothetical protein